MRSPRISRIYEVGILIYILSQNLSYLGCIIEFILSARSERLKNEPYDLDRDSSIAFNDFPEGLNNSYIWTVLMDVVDGCPFRAPDLSRSLFPRRYG